MWMILKAFSSKDCKIRYVNQSTKIELTKLRSKLLELVHYLKGIESIKLGHSIFGKSAIFLASLSLIKGSTLILVRLWNFKDGGSYKARFLAKNWHNQRIFFQNNGLMNYGLSKSAKIVLSKPIFYVKIQKNI